jgi:hypothetical protein
MNWAVGVEVGESPSEDPWEATETSLVQKDEQRSGRWFLSQPLDGVDLVRGGGGELFSFPTELFRIFKLVGLQRERGRRLRCLTRGRFLVVAPLDWKLNPGSDTREAIAPEYVLGARYRAYHLQVLNPLAGRAVFDTPTGRVELPVQAPGFELDGDQLADAHPDAVPLFHRSPPRLLSSRNIPYGKVVVGEEGPRVGTTRWRDFGTDFEDLRPKIAARRAGWFFVRLYDGQDELIDSLDFRFSSRLEGLEVQAPGPLPDQDGHRPAFVQILHDEGLDVVLKANFSQDPLPVRTIPGGSRIEIPPSPTYDVTSWSIREGPDHIVEVWLQIHRIWWALLEEGSGSGSGWTDRALALRDEDVLATSRRVLRIRLPPICWGKDIRVGIGPQRSLRPSWVTGRVGEMELPCRELGRFEQGALYSEFQLCIESEPTSTSARPSAVLATRGLQVEEMQCIQKAGERNIALEISWVEKGRVQEKILSLWRSPADRADPIREQVIPGWTSTAIMEVRDLAPGRYLLQVARRDLQLSAESPPREGDANTLVIQVVPSGELRTGEAFCIEAIKDSGGEYQKLEVAYWVRIVGKIVHLKLPPTAERANVLVKALNEGWYCGRLEVELPFPEEAGLEAEFNQGNPVRFEYSPSEEGVTSIEDRHGDGAMFCSDCGRLYWDAERLRSEGVRKHSLHGPIAVFRIRWNPSKP